MQILTSNTSIESAMLLRDKIKEICGNHYWVTKNPDSIKDDYIRYGSSEYVNPKFKSSNSREFVKFCINKDDFCRLASENGIFCPVFHETATNLSFPLIIRKTLTSYGGKGIVLCKSPKQFKTHWLNGFYWTPFIKTQSEFRVHVLNGKIARLFRKQYVSDNNEPELPIRNLDAGYHYSLVDYSDKKVLINTLKKIHSFLPAGADFYSVDIGWSEEKKKYFVFEINSGSGLNNNTARVYAEFLCQKFNLI